MQTAVADERWLFEGRFWLNFVFQFWLSVRLPVSATFSPSSFDDAFAIQFRRHIIVDEKVDTFSQMFLDGE
jgi:hypothetical protein